MPYTFSAATADADPSAGNLRASTATFVPGAAIVLRMDLVDNLGVTRTAQLDLIGSAANPIKSVVRIQKPGDGSQFVDIVVTAIASPAGYKNITGTVLAASSPAPFANNDSLVVMYVRNGDQGAPGAIASYELISSLTITGTPSVLNFSGIPQTYSDLLWIFDAPISIATTVWCALSNNGANYSPGFNLITGAGVNPVRGQVSLRGYRQDYQVAEAWLADLISASPNSANIATSTPVVSKVTGGVTAARLGLNSSATWTNGGTVKLLGK